MLGERARPFGPLPAFDPSTLTLILVRTKPYSSTPSPPSPNLKRWPTGLPCTIATSPRSILPHGHFDHFAGLSVLLRRFPEARAIATPKSVELMRKQSQAIPLFRKRWPGQLPGRIVLPEPYDKDVFILEGHELRIIEQGRTDAIDTTSLHVPSIDLVGRGESSTTSATCTSATPRRPSSRRNATSPTSAGSKAQSGDRELYDAMTQLSPVWVSQQACLIFGFGASPSRPGNKNVYPRQLREEQP